MRTALYKIISDAVQKALRPLARDVREIDKLKVSRKGIGDFVTSADTRTEFILKKELGAARPDFGFIAEESDEVVGKDKSHFWIIDPIDGTTNFMHSVPHFSISIALCHKDDIIAAYIFDPLKNEEFYAEKGRGAYLNGDRMRVSHKTELSESLIGTGLPFVGCTGFEEVLKELAIIMPRTAGIRRMGSAALDMAYVAAGRYEAYWERNINIWDIAAGALLVQEAGGKLSKIDGTMPKTLPELLKGKDIYASNGVLHNTFGDLLKKAKNS